MLVSSLEGTPSSLLKDSIREISGAVAHPPCPKCPKLETYVGQLKLSGVEKWAWRSPSRFQKTFIVEMFLTLSTSFKIAPSFVTATRKLGSSAKGVPLCEGLWYFLGCIKMSHPTKNEKIENILRLVLFDLPLANPVLQQKKWWLTSTGKGFWEKSLHTRLDVSHSGTIYNNLGNN